MQQNCGARRRGAGRWQEFVLSLEGIAMPLHILRTSTPRPRVPEAQLGFGQVFTDHMLLMDYTPQAGWHQPGSSPMGRFRWSLRRSFSTMVKRSLTD